MKSNKLILIPMIIAALCTFGIKAHSAGINAQQWITNLRSLEINQVDVDGNRLLPMPPADQQVLEQLRYGDLVSKEGIPAAGTMAKIVGHNGYSTAEYLQTILTDIGDLHNGHFVYSIPLGTGIQQLYDQAHTWVASSGTKLTETYPRIMLNRCVDFFELMFPVAGSNTDEVRRFFANFWEKCYVNAIAYANNNLVVTENEHLLRLPSKVANYAKAYESVNPRVAFPVRYRSMVKFAYEQATFFYKNTTNYLAEEANAVGLIRLLGYLGYDNNSDLRRRRPEIVKTMTDIRRIQNSRGYMMIVTALGQARMFNPRERQAARILRVKVSRLMKKLPDRILALDGQR